MGPQDQEIMQAMMARQQGGQMPPQAPPQAQQAPQGAPQGGPDPAQAQEARMGAPQPAPPQPQDNPNVKTDSEKALAAAGAKEQDAPPVSYRIKFGEEERELNEQQIRSTFERYAAMNHRWQSEVAPLKPVMELAQRIMQDAQQRGIKASPQEIAQVMQAATLAYAKNPQMGQQAQDQGQNVPKQPPMSMDADDFGKWEQENAVSLPPGYRETNQKIGQIEQALMQMMQMLQGQQQNGQQQSAQHLQQAQQLNQGAGQAQAAAIRQTIGNNLAMAQQQLGLPDEAEQDFFQFAFSRGYTIEDFVNPELAMGVATDFKNNMNSPEMERLKAMAQRRQAFTGLAEGAPAMGGSAAQQQGDPMFNQMIDMAMSRRNP